jgi:hypothetical protein
VSNFQQTSFSGEPLLLIEINGELSVDQNLEHKKKRLISPVAPFGMNSVTGLCSPSSFKNR